MSQGHARLAALLSDAQAAKLADVLEPLASAGRSDTVGVMIEIRRGGIAGVVAAQIRKIWGLTT